ncbi:SGNH/GDSL hydrolase family protein [Companilactobacillus baiquanensis]|uniref:SGNH/GDSL hydrolase family protein n=1 Tax=Companilactobacillus baiquanensis TaxID=2486005 RepID=A0ABW1UV87_9LACO|nr:SGNH/GDSL hydrolase family protein [Companilactobacillus baiquanensis]
MITTDTWLQEFSDYHNIYNINESGHQEITIFKPLATKEIRLLINNLYDNVPLKITKLTLNKPGHKPMVVTVNGQSNFEIAPKTTQWTDWLNIDIKANDYLTINIYSPNKTIHSLGSNLSESFTKVKNFSNRNDGFFFGISAVQAQVQKKPIKIAFFGDSLTNQGFFSAPLSKELTYINRIVTANYGISGNRLLRPGSGKSQWVQSFGPAGVDRFDEMLMDFQPDIVIFMEGVNDLLHPGAGSPISELPTSKELIAGINELNLKCSQNNIIFVPMTVTPFRGNINNGIYAWNPKKEVIRQEFNKYIIQSFPYAVDLAPFVSDASQTRLAYEFDSGDHIHTSKCGGKKIARFIERNLIDKGLVAVVKANRQVI